jgi:hypothetical protein
MLYDKQFGLTTFADMRRQLLNDAEAELKGAGMHPKDIRHKKGVLAIHEHLKRGSISRDAFDDLVGLVLGEKLLETNVFSYHIHSNQVSFQSDLMRRYCELNSAQWNEGDFLRVD